MEEAVGVAVVVHFQLFLRDSPALEIRHRLIVQAVVAGEEVEGVC